MNKHHSKKVTELAAEKEHLSCLSFAILADAHICQAYPDERTQSLRKVIAEINSKSPSFTIGLGDMIEGISSETNFNGQWAVFKNEMAYLNNPYYLVRGNHEAVSGWARERNVNKWLDATKYDISSYSFDIGNFHFIIFDSHKTIQSELEWLKADLDTTDKKVIICAHIPIITFAGQEWQTGNKYAQDILESHAGKIICVLCAHLHENAYQEINNVKHYGMARVWRDDSWGIVTVYSTGEVEIRGYKDNESYLPTSSHYLAKHFSYYRNIYFDNSLFIEDRFNYPVRIRLTYHNFDFSKVRADGTDIRFSDSSGKVLNYEVDYWRDGDAVIWVKAPLLHGRSTSDYIRMYYGNSNAGNAENPRGVWGNKQLISYFAEANDVTGDTVTRNGGGKIGYSYVKNTVALPIAGNKYSVTYNPPGTWDFSEPGLELVWWIRCNRDYASFSTARLYIYDINDNYRYWDIRFIADTWKKAVITLANGIPSEIPPNMSAIKKISWELKAADTMEFQQDLDLCYTYAGYNVVLHFNEDSGEVLHNSTVMSAYSAPGKINNGSWSNNGLVFNGSSTFAEFPYSDEYNVYENGYTLEAYITSKATSGVKVIASHEDILRKEVAMRLHLLNMRPRIIIHDGINNNFCGHDCSITPGMQNHVAATFDKRNMIAYLNGIASPPTARTTPVPPDFNNFYIGIDKGKNAVYYWDGTINEFRWTNIARNADYFSETVVKVQRQHLINKSLTRNLLDFYQINNIKIVKIFKKCTRIILIKFRSLLGILFRLFSRISFFRNK